MYQMKELLKSSLLIVLFCADNANADVLQVNASVSSGHYLRGIELADDGLALSLSADWSSDNGLFAGAECYVGGAERFASFDDACIGYLGYFHSANKNNAFSTKATRYHYGAGEAIDWDTNEYSVSWHYRDFLLVSATYSDNWLARNTATTAVDISYRKPFNDKLTLVTQAGVLRPNDSATIDTLYTANVTLEYHLDRWAFALKASAIDSSSRDNLPFEIDQPELIWSIRYQLY